MGTAPQERRQVGALARAFLARFFDNDLTAGSTDLKHSFLWLIAAAAMPGLAMPNSNMERWSRLAITAAVRQSLENALKICHVYCPPKI